MSGRVTNNTVGYEPIPGYVLRKRLGAGGYGEVWLADAPGGLQKAIKLIYGRADESYATSELRSLQRIRQVYHPFLLSLERIEIVGNQVIIVTELAESSLLDRFEQHRRKGAPGIPRAVLLDYLRDTADALDFLAQKHALQHLDIKPGNLLIIADRIKVADFGLIKDLHDKNQSLVSGLTPTYSAPEVFDGLPDYRSDQYSLSIVYMEMLTGQLPFEGRTTGELARQHINQAPNLDALPPADRPIVARALSKNPLDRFSTCRLFVEQLQKARNSVLPAAPQKRLGARSEMDSDDTGIVETVPAPALGNKVVFQESVNTELLSGQWTNPRSLFIGLGGVGGRALVALRKTVNRDCDCRLGIDDLGWLAIDTDATALNDITDSNLDSAVPAGCAIQLPIYKPSDYRNAEPELFGPLSRRWLYNIPRTLVTEGVRPLAILTLLDHYRQLKAKITAELKHLVAQHAADEECHEPMRIYVLSSLHGGTGSGLLSEIGLLVRRVLSQLRFSDYRLSAAVTAATTTNCHAANLPSAAAIASLSELSHLMNANNEVLSIFYGDRADVASNMSPFDWVTLIDGGLHGNQRELEAAVHTMANVVWLDAQTMAGAVLNESRSSCRDQRYGWLRTASVRPIQVTSNISAQNLARWCCEQTLNHAMRYMAGPRGVATSSSAIFADHNDDLPTTSGDLPLTDQVCDEFTKRLLTSLGVVKAKLPLPELAGPVMSDTLLGQWARRLSNNNELINNQLAADIKTWKESIAKIVQMRVYNWKQVEQIQLNVIEGILDYCENETTELVKTFEPFSEMLGSPDAMLKAAVDYLRRFSEECVNLLNHFQREGKAMVTRIRSWCDSIDAEKALNEASWDVNILSLPPRLQLLASRVNAVLESTLHRLALQILDDSEESLGLPIAKKRISEIAETINLTYMLSLSSDLVSRIAGEAGIEDDEFREVVGDDEGVSIKKLEDFFPILSQSGGDVLRLIVAPAEQLKLVSKALAKRNLGSQTTVIASTRSLGSYVLCDAVDLHLPQLISALWRPCQTTLQLSERLRTRVDVEWEAATALLESPVTEEPLIEEAAAAAYNPIVVELEAGQAAIGTAQLPLDA